MASRPEARAAKRCRFLDTEAEAAALKNAGKSAEEVVFKKAKLEKDDGRLVYEIEFYEAEGFEYEYEIDALTGELLGFEIERWDGD